MKISVLIPAHNEERSIKATVDSCLRQTRPFDQIVVVNDGSTDHTGEILATYRKRIKVVTIMPATGNKSHAQQAGLKHVTGDVFVATDGDTILDERFAEFVEPHFADPRVMAVAGYVKSMKLNWLTACRELDYLIGQDIYKTAQGNIGYLFVIPGCAGTFRTEAFKNSISFDHDTLTEDLDFTYKIHRQHLKIAFERRAVVFTQDPFTLHAYINQMRRWYSGGWQNLMKHLRHIIQIRPAAAFELSFIYLEGFVFSILLFLFPFIDFRLFYQFIFLYLILLVAVSIYAAWSRRRLDLLFSAPGYLLLKFINSWIFLEQFVLEVVLQKRKLVWFKPARKAIN